MAAGYPRRPVWVSGMRSPVLAVAVGTHHIVAGQVVRDEAQAGLEREARAVLAKFAGTASSRAVETDDARHPGAPVIDEQHPVTGLRALLRGRHARISWGLLLAGLAWGLVNFGFLLWLPVNLVQMGVDAAGASALLARSAVLALPGIAVVIALYHRWSSVRALVLFIALTALALLAFVAIGVLGLKSQAVTVAATVALLVSVSGVIAMLIPYAAEIYPVHLRGTGAGVIAASSKAGGILGAGLGVMGFFANFTVSALVLAVPMAVAAAILLRHGVETRGHRLEDIQQALGS